MAHIFSAPNGPSILLHPSLIYWGLPSTYLCTVLLLLSLADHRKPRKVVLDCPFIETKRTIPPRVQSIHRVVGGDQMILLSSTFIIPRWPSPLLLLLVFVGSQCHHSTRYFTYVRYVYLQPLSRWCVWFSSVFLYIIVPTLPLLLEPHFFLTGRSLHWSLNGAWIYLPREIFDVIWSIDGIKRVVTGFIYVPLLNGLLRSLRPPFLNNNIIYWTITNCWSFLKFSSIDSTFLN